MERDEDVLFHTPQFFLEAEVAVLDALLSLFCHPRLSPGPGNRDGSSKKVGDLGHG